MFGVAGHGPALFFQSTNTLGGATPGLVTRDLAGQHEVWHGMGFNLLTLVVWSWHNSPRPGGAQHGANRRGSSWQGFIFYTALTWAPLGSAAHGRA